MAEYHRFDYADADPVPSENSGTPHVDLTEPLALSESKAKVWYLERGDALSRHTEPIQEELYVVLDGPGRMRVGGEELDVEEGEAVSVPPDTERQVFNDTDREHVWLIVGAPPG